MALLDKHYDPHKIEEGLYEEWKQNGDFIAEGEKSKKTPFSLVLPPPNVTGKLHLGHAMDTIPMDILARYHRMLGEDVLWVPGMDHAGIATQAKVEEELRKEGLTSKDLGREEFLKRCYKWKEEHAHLIHEQWKALGLSLDYTRERFTLDEGIQEAVKTVFRSLYEKGLIYRGKKIINWDPVFETALSDIEVIHEEEKGKMYYFLYEVEGGEKMVVATTRPETMFGDVAVFVSPKSEKYASFVGKKAKNPANGEWLPIMADEYVDPSFGTGAMKCTPAHDPNDFILGEKYHLPAIACLDSKAHMLPIAGEFVGLDRYECREKLVEKIAKEGHLVKIENITHAVGHSERSHAIVEPMLSQQWFLKMDEIAKLVRETQKDPAKKVYFKPKRFEKTLLRWMENCHDWCLSRQLWWGHRIPVWYKGDPSHPEDMIVCPDKDTDLTGYTQDSDVLDTWFSSGLWPFATLGWPKESADFKRYFPNSILVTGYDIIFFWVSRMIFQSLLATGKAPFHEVIIHGLVRDREGRKMSKSLGNGVDPIDIIEQYGVDALRFFITNGTAPGLDIRYEEEKVASARDFLNKVWNAARYLQGIIEEEKPSPLFSVPLGHLEKGILAKLSRVYRAYCKNMDEFAFAKAGAILRNFVYEEFCGKYLEWSKVSVKKGGKEKAAALSTLAFLLKAILLLLHPFAPFVTDRIYEAFAGKGNSLMKQSLLEACPMKGKRPYYSAREEASFDLLYTMIQEARAYKVNHHLAPNAPIQIILSQEPFPSFGDYLARFTFATSVKIGEESTNAFRFSSFGKTYSLSLVEDISLQEQKARLEKEIARLKADIARSENMLSNPGFMAKAPKEKIALEEEKRKGNQALLEEALMRIAKL